MKKSNLFSAWKNIVYLTQVGFSVAFPLIICLIGAGYLRDRFALGDWVMLLGIVLGLGSAAESFYTFLKYVERQGKKPPRK
ncbi:MAG: AtpZ/AtpI family protein [Oscillospiraceae bacterium]